MCSAITTSPQGHQGCCVSSSKCGLFGTCMGSRQFQVLLSPSSGASSWWWRGLQMAAHLLGSASRWQHSAASQLRGEDGSANLCGVCSACWVCHILLHRWELSCLDNQYSLIIPVSDMGTSCFVTYSYFLLFWCVSLRESWQWVFSLLGKMLHVQISKRERSLPLIYTGSFAQWSLWYLFNCCIKYGVSSWNVHAPLNSSEV